MSDKIHEGHEHIHGEGCGHTAIRHGDHVGYLHDGHLHYPHGDRMEEHALEVSDRNPDACTPRHSCAGHPGSHVHGPGCGHEPVPHGNHVDYLINDHLHHPHGDHCDDHGKVDVVRRQWGD